MKLGLPSELAADGVIDINVDTGVGHDMDSSREAGCIIGSSVMI